MMDEGPRHSVQMPPDWKLIARDAFNGVILWKRDISQWQTHLWPLKSGPAQLPRRLVSDGDRVYATLNLDGPLTARTDLFARKDIDGGLVGGASLKAEDFLAIYEAAAT